MTDRIIAARKDPLGLSTMNEVPCVANRVRARGAGIGDNRYWSLERKGLGQIQCLPLWLVVADAGSLTAVVMRRLRGLTIVGLAEAHTATRRSKHNRQMFGGRPS